MLFIFDIRNLVDIYIDPESWDLQTSNQYNITWHVFELITRSTLKAFDLW